MTAHRRRDAVQDRERYAPWNPAERLMREERERLAARELARIGRFPSPGMPVLEIGYGHGGWLPTLLGWGMRDTDLHGIELDLGRAEVARAALSGADLRIGDATELPWADETFALVVISTVCSSVLDQERRTRIGAEAMRVLAVDGVLLWYDLARDNPRNPDVRGIGRGELGKLFGELDGMVRRVTLAPPLARLVAPRVWWLAGLLQSVPLLRTHLLAVLERRTKL